MIPSLGQTQYSLPMVRLDRPNRTGRDNAIYVKEDRHTRQLRVRRFLRALQDRDVVLPDMATHNGGVR
jgi:hypothetical protein